MNFHLVEPLLHFSPNSVVNRLQIWTVGSHRSGEMKAGVCRSRKLVVRFRGGATFTEVGGTNHGERSEPENFFVVPPKRGYKYHFAPSNRGYKIIAKITRRLVQKCTTWFRSTNFTSCSPQNHCTVIFYYGTRYWPISRFCHIFLSPFTVFNAFP